jgi:hypothetical protein
MKPLADAEFLRRRIIGALELADQEADPAVRKQLLTRSYWWAPGRPAASWPAS